MSIHFDRISLDLAFIATVRLCIRVILPNDNDFGMQVMCPSAKVADLIRIRDPLEVGLILITPRRHFDIHARAALLPCRNQGPIIGQLIQTDVFHVLNL